MERKALKEWMDNPKNHARIVRVLSELMTKSVNEQYIPIEEKLVEKHIQCGQEHGEWRSSTQILNYLNNIYPRKLAVVSIGKALGKLGFIKKRSVGITYYLTDLIRY